jgi:hypothetical protein
MRRNRLAQIALTALVLTGLLSGWLPGLQAQELPQEGGNDTPTAASLAPSTEAAAPWIFERVDAPKLFVGMSDRSLAVDAAGHPHIAYGRDFITPGTTGQAGTCKRWLTQGEWGWMPR